MRARPAPRVCILLALYNGAAHLRVQLDSYAAQTRQDWSLLVSDDGSADAGPAILAQFAADHPGHAVTCLQGPGRGFVRNFFFMLTCVAADMPYAALSDQDDQWLPEKLDRAVQALQAVPPGVPALYCARTVICDAALKTLGVSSAFRQPPAFQNALVQSIGGGNTMVLNRAALDLVRAAVDEAQDAIAHDWWLYQIITACNGRVINDPVPMLHYRQHGGNAIGANMSARARMSRILFILDGRFRGWNRVNLAALHRSRARFTPAAQTALDFYTAARQGPLLRRLRNLHASGVYRQSRRGTVALYLACIFRRL
jgi:glycosyltransferase involved in cell wall biosynthesis